MDLIIGLLILLVVAPIVIFVVAVVWITRAIQWYFESRSLLNKPVPVARRQFLHDLFGLTVEDCKLLRFDGYDFYFSRKRSYREFTSAFLLGVREVRIINTKLPHRTTWQHTRVDGGPDRRYHSNPQIHLSRRFRVRFVGRNKRTLSGYVGPYDNIQKALEKLNNLLAVGGVVDLEVRFSDYANAFHQVQKYRGLFYRARAKRAQIESVVIAIRRLEAGGLSDDPSISSKAAEAASELSHWDTEVCRLQQEIASATSRMSEVVHIVNAEIGRYKDFQKVSAYQFSSSQEKAEQPRGETQPKQGQKRRILKDYYRVLQVDPSAESEVVTGAYRRLAAKYHPDVYKGEDANRRMQMINEAYAVLSDPTKRKQYDQARDRQMQQ